MSRSTDIFIPIDEPGRVPVGGSLGVVDRLAELFTDAHLDTAMDRAARCSRATVAIFVAAPRGCRADYADGDRQAAIEFAIEFFVPPASVERFHRELEAQLLLISPGYVTGRYRGEFGPCEIHRIGSGTFHRCQIIYPGSAAGQPEARWSFDRLPLDGVLHHIPVGRRELET